MQNRTLFAVFALIAIAGLVAATGEDISGRFNNMGCTIYNALKNILPILIVVVIIFAGVIYVVGQVFGAETKSKAQSWAQNMIIGTLIAIIIVLAVPFLIDIMAPELSINAACA